MKDFCLKVALLLFLSNSTLYTQQNLPVLEEGKQWVINRSVTDINNNITFEASGDSVLNGIHYTVIGNELLREEGAKVYVYNNFFQGEKVLYT